MAIIAESHFAARLLISFGSAGLEALGFLCQITLDISYRLINTSANSSNKTSALRLLSSMMPKVVPARVGIL